MSKILKKYTTIPQELYVEREADNQLKSIIYDMERPGYVLVSRQMGKTNLLLNAKRTLESSERYFAYVDLSNLFLTERECFRGIIDDVIMPNENLSVLNLNIEAIRSKDYPAHIEYLRSLLIILKTINSDLVIILDEIDALKSVEYSDNIFAQIRSTYFQRVSYPELKKLTYVLSGVIEPSDLIKDKNKSPFNIGDKIYLNDFSVEEMLMFNRLSNLNLEPELIEYLYSWTGGNPRINYEVFTEMEDLKLKGIVITKEKIDHVISQKYLHSFDIPPIDHIRELVKSNNDVIDILKRYHNDEKLNIPEHVYSKLFLFGITNSMSDFRIKNKIIERALSLEWLNSINKEDSFFLGILQYSKREYDRAIALFKEALVNQDNPIEIENINYYLGLCYFMKNEFKPSMNYFLTVKNENKKEILYDAKAYLALCYISLGETDTGLELLMNIRENSEHYSLMYKNALLNLAIHFTDPVESLSVLDELDEILDRKITNEEESFAIHINEIKCYSDFCKASNNLKLGKIEEGVNYLRKSYNIAEQNNKIYVGVELLKITSVATMEGFALQILDELLKILESGSYNLDNSLSKVLVLTDVRIIELLVLLYNKHSIDDAVNVFSKKMKIDKRNILFDVYLRSSNNKIRFAREYNDVVESFGSLYYEDFVSFITSKDIISQNRDIFFDVFNSYRASILNRTVLTSDCFNFLKVIIYVIDQKAYYIAIAYLEEILSLIKESEGMLDSKVLIYYWAVILYRDKLNLKKEYVYYRDEMFKEIKNIERSNDYLNFKNNMLAILKSQL